MKLSERVTSFQTYNSALSPDQLYIAFKQSLPDDRKHQYITGPINSGGARRRHSFDGLQSEQIQDQIKLIASENIVFANSLLRLLLTMHLIDADAIVTSPYHLGERQYIPAGHTEVRPWNEVEYLLFWSMVIFGMSEDAVTEFFVSAEGQIRDSSAKLNARELPREQRIEQYRQMEKIVVATLYSLPDTSSRPIDTLLKFPDSHYSLGSVFEQRLAYTLQIPSCEVVFNVDHPHLPALDIYQDVVFQHLKGTKGGLPLVTNDKTPLPIQILPVCLLPDYQ